MVHIEALNHSVADLGEGPHWDIATQSLYFVDINGPTIYRYDYKTNKTYEAKIENETYASFIIPIEGKPNQFAVGLKRRVCSIEWDGLSPNCKNVATLFEVESNDPALLCNRFNDGKADPVGRFYGGTMPCTLDGGVFKTKRTGNLYRYEKGLRDAVLVKDNVCISNGLAWNTKINKFYYIDSSDVEVKSYDYDIKNGQIKNPKVVIDFRPLVGDKPDYVPDGMTIDSDGFLYVATFGGSKVFKVNPTNGKIEMEMKFPCEQITSVAFGGPNLDILYVTTSAMGGKPAPAGQTFKVTGLGVKGLEMQKLKV